MDRTKFHGSQLPVGRVQLTVAKFESLFSPREIFIGFEPLLIIYFLSGLSEYSYSVLSFPSFLTQAELLNYQYNLLAILNWMEQAYV